MKAETFKIALYSLKIRILYKVVGKMSNEEEMIFAKIRLMLNSPIERANYAKLTAIQAKISFLISYFITNEMANKFLSRINTAPIEEQYKFIREVDYILQE